MASHFLSRMLLLSVLLSFLSINTANAQQEVVFESVATASSHDWTSQDVGTIVRTLAFNVPVSQIWTLQDQNPNTVGSFGVSAGDFWLKLVTNAYGISLKELGGVPVEVDANCDNIPVWNLAQQLNLPVLLDDFYAGSSTFQVQRDGLVVRGTGQNVSGFVGQNNSLPVFSTNMAGMTGTHTNLELSSFSINGVGQAAMVITHVTVSSIDNISIEGFQGENGFVFEYMWGNSIGLLKTNGALISHSAFKFNAGVLDTVFEHLYSSNFSDYSFDFNNTRIEYSVPQAGGDGVNTVLLMTAQGANVAAININGLSRYKIINVYSENNQEMLHVSGNVSDVSISGDLQGVRSSTTRSVLLDGNISGFTFDDVSFPNELIEIGKINTDVYFDSPRVTGNRDIVSLLRRNSNTPSSMPLTIDYQTTSHSKRLVKTNGWSWKFRNTYFDNNGNQKSDLVDIPLM